MAQKILILGGTAEAAELAASLCAQGHDVTTSLAGRTREPGPVSGSLRIGGFGGPQGLTSFLRSGRFDRLIDATHPFAEQISRHARIAANAAGVPLDVRIRQPWKPLRQDRWINCDTLETARDSLPEGARVFLAIGSRHASKFTTRPDVFFLLRQVDPEPHVHLPTNFAVVAGKAHANAAPEIDLMRQYSITHLLCRNAGGRSAYGKIVAARRLGLPVLMVRPPVSAPTHLP